MGKRSPFVKALGYTSWKLKKETRFIEIMNLPRGSSLNLNSRVHNQRAPPFNCDVMWAGRVLKLFHFAESSAPASKVGKKEALIVPTRFGLSGGRTTAATDSTRRILFAVSHPMR